MFRNCYKSSTMNYNSKQNTQMILIIVSTPIKHIQKINLLGIMIMEKVLKLGQIKLILCRNALTKWKSRRNWLKETKFFVVSAKIWS